MSDFIKERRILRSTMKRRRLYELEDNEKFEKGENEDRLSDLSDGIILHILSFLDAKYAVQTCVLSTRWKYLWKFIPTLILHSSSFSTVRQFAKFVSKILTLRDNTIALQAFDLDRYGDIEPRLLEKILNYVCSHNTHLQELGISTRIAIRDETRLIKSCVASCQALTSLKLSVWNRGCIIRDNSGTFFPKSLNLPALTSLNLKGFVFCGGQNKCADPFSTFTKLNNLVIENCKVKDAQILRISSETLVNLAMHENLFFFDKLELSTPSLCTLTYFDTSIMRICVNGLSSVKKLDIAAKICYNLDENAMVLLSWLLDLANVKTFTVCSTTLQILSLIPDSLEIKLPSLCNLLSMEIKLEPLEVYGGMFNKLKEKILKKVAAKSMNEAAKLRKEDLKPPPIPDGIVAFLLQNSPSAKVDITTKYPDTFKINQDDKSSNEDKVEKCQPNVATT